MYSAPSGSDPSLLRRIAFASASGMTRSVAEAVIGMVGSVDHFFDMTARQLMATSAVNARMLSDEYRSELLEMAAVERDFAVRNNVDCRFCTDADAYPERLALCEDAPAMLYTLGHNCLDRKCIVAIVGTRHATAYGTMFATRLVGDLAAALGDRLVVVSGLAYGIDVAAHRAAIEAGVPTVAVVAHGLNKIYPTEHRPVAKRILETGGMIVTEYTSQAAMHRGNFLARNRIIAGLSDVTVVVESDTRGGAMSTARMAQAYGREVMALPGRVTDAYSRGCNKLIYNHTAAVVRDAADLMALMDWHGDSSADAALPRQQTLFPELNQVQQLIVDYLRQHPDATANDLCVGLSMPYSAVSAELLRMAMEGLVMQLPGGRYAPIDS